MLTMLGVSTFTMFGYNGIRTPDHWYAELVCTIFIPRAMNAMLGHLVSPPVQIIPELIRHGFCPHRFNRAHEARD
jgi:hypothetical protein